MGVSGAGASTQNKVASQINAYIDGVGDDGVQAASVALSASDQSAITAFAGAASIAASFGSTGVAVSIGVGLARNSITNDVSAYITNAPSIGNVAGVSTDARYSTLDTATDLQAGDRVRVAEGYDIPSYDTTLAGTTNPVSLVTGNTVHLDDGYGVANYQATTQGTEDVQTVGFGEFIQVDGGAVYRFIDDSAPTQTFDINAEDYADDTRWVQVGGQAGATYVYQGSDQTLDISRQDYSTADWKKIGGAAGTVYQYTGAPGSLDLSQQDYTDTALWTPVSVGGISLTASETANIKATAVAASVAVAGAAGAGVAVSGAGADAENIIHGNTQAFVTNSTLLSAGDVNLTATDTSAIDANIISVAAALGIGGGAGVGVAIGSSTAQNTIGYAADGETIDPSTVLAFISDSQVDARGSIALQATEEATITANIDAIAVALAGGGVGVAASGAGVGVTNRIAITVDSYISDSTGTGITTRAGDITLNASDTSNITATGLAASVAGSVGYYGGSVAIGVALSKNTITNTVEAYVDSATINTTGGGLTVDATENATVTGSSKAAAVSVSASIGGSLAGGGANAIATVTSTTKAYVDSSTVTLDGNLEVSAIDTSKADARVKATSVSLGLIAVAVSGSVARATVLPEVEAYVNATGVTAQDISLLAKSIPEAHAEAAGLSVSTGASVGVSKAIATVGQQGDFPSATAYIGGQNSVITANNLTVTAQTTLPESGDSAYASAHGSSGGLLIGIDATVTNATSNYALSSSILDDTTLDIQNGTSVLASGAAHQTAISNSAAFGLVAVGATKANAESNTTTTATLGDRVKLTGGFLSVSASGEDNNFAQTTAGAGGVVGVAAAAPTTSNTSVTTASIGEGTADRAINLMDRGSGQFLLNASHIATFNTQVITNSYGLLSGSGAVANNTVDATVDAVAGDNAYVIARGIDMAATNDAEKPALADDALNIEGNTGGLYSVAGAYSTSLLTLNTDVTVGTDTFLQVGGPASNDHIFKLRALNIINGIDAVSFHTGGALSGAQANLTFKTLEDSATVTVGDGAEMLSSGALDISARGQADVKGTVAAETYGAATVATGTSDVRILPVNTITIAAGSAANPTHLLAYGDLNLTTGRSADADLVLSADPYAIESRWDGFAGSIIPISDVDAKAFFYATNIITTGTDTLLQSARQASLYASKESTALLTAKAKVVSWVSAIGDALSSLGGNSQEQYSGHLLGEAQSKVEVNGTIETGLTRQQSLSLNDWAQEGVDENGNPIVRITDYTADPGITFSYGVKQLESNLVQQLRQDQDTLAQYGSYNATLKAFYEGEISRIQQELADSGQSMQVQRFNSDGTPVLENGQPVYDTIYPTREVLTVIVEPIWAQAGRIDVNADQFTGTGKFIAPSDASVTIINNTPFFLELKGINIPDVASGLFYNGELVTSPTSAGNADIVTINERQANADNAINYPGVDPQANTLPADFSQLPDPAVGANVPKVIVKNTLVDPPTVTVDGTSTTLPLPDITVLAPQDGGNGIFNDRGSVDLETAGGSINILGTVRSQTLTVVAGGDVYVSGVTSFSVGGDPANLLGPATSGTYGAGAATAPGVKAATEGSSAWNAAMGTSADLLFSVTSLSDFDALLSRLSNPVAGDRLSQALWQNISADTQTLLLDTKASFYSREAALVDALNKILVSTDLVVKTTYKIPVITFAGIRYVNYTVAASYPSLWSAVSPGYLFDGFNISAATKALAATNPTGLGLVRLNHLLLQEAYPAAIVSSTASPYNVFGDRIHIEAEFINVNGIMQSGRADYTLTLNNNALSEATSKMNAGQSGRLYLETASAQNPGFSVFYNTVEKRFEVDELKTGGGYIELFGHVLNTSTNTGLINVLGGYSTITINNETSQEVFLNRLDVSQRGSGTLLIVDKAAGGPATSNKDPVSVTSINTDVVFTASSAGHPGTITRSDGADWTGLSAGMTIRVTGSGTNAASGKTFTIASVNGRVLTLSDSDVTVATTSLDIITTNIFPYFDIIIGEHVTITTQPSYTSLYQWSPGGVVLTTNGSSDPAHAGTVSIIGNYSTYQPSGDWRYGWTTVVEENKIYKKHITSGSWLGAIPDVFQSENIHWDSIEVHGTPHYAGSGPYFYQYVSAATDLSGATSATDPYAYKHTTNVVTSGPVVRTYHNDYWTWYGSHVYVSDYQKIDGQQELHTHSINATNQIHINFIGSTEGAITINSVGDVVLNGPILNPGGATTIHTTGSITAVGDAYITGSRIDLIAGTGLGTLASPLQTDVVDIAYTYQSTDGIKELNTPAYQFGSPDGPQTVSNGMTVRIADGYSSGGKGGSVYRYVGSTAIQLDLSVQNYSNKAMWQEVIPTVQDVVQVGDKFYRYIGAPASVDLSVANYNDTGKWVENPQRPSLRAVTATGDVAINEITGDLPVDQISALGGGSVLVMAKGAITVGHQNSTTWYNGIVSGGRVTLTALGGGIGSSAVHPLKLDSALGSSSGMDVNGLVNVTLNAQGDVYLMETQGDLFLNQLITTGNAWISVPNGSLIDANNSKIVDERSRAQLVAGVWGDLQLTNYTNGVYTGNADNKINDTISAFESGKQAEYRTFWQYDAAYDGTTVKLSDTERAAYTELYQSQGMSDTEIADALVTLENSRTAQYLVLKDEFTDYFAQRGEPFPTSFDPAFVYTATDAKKSEIRASIKVWTEDELLRLVGSGLLKSVTSTRPDIEAPNIVAKIVTLDIGNGNVGRTTDPLTIVLPVAIEATVDITASSPGVAGTITRVDGVTGWAGLTPGMVIKVAESGNPNASLSSYTIAEINGDTLTLSADDAVYASNGLGVTVLPSLTEDQTVALAAAERGNVTYLAGEVIPALVDFTASSAGNPGTITRVDGVSGWGDLSAGMTIKIAGLSANANSGLSSYTIAGIDGNTLTLSADDNIVAEYGRSVSVLPVLADPLFEAQGEPVNAEVTFAYNGFDAAGQRVPDTITRTDDGSWLDDGYVEGSLVRISGTSPNATADDDYFTVASVDATGKILTLIARDKVITDTNPTSLVFTRGTKPVLKELIVAQSDDVNIKSSDSISIVASGNVLIGSAPYQGTDAAMNIRKVEAGTAAAPGSIIIKSAKDIISSALPGDATVQGGNLILESADGSIGSYTGAFFTDLFGDSTLTARASGDVYISERTSGGAGDMNIESVYSQSGTVHLEADGSILDGVHSAFTKIKANLIELVAGGSIGSAGTNGNPDFIETDLIDPGTLTAVAENGIWIAETTGNLNLRDVVSKNGDVYLQAQLSILDAVDVNDPTSPTFHDPSASSTTDVTSGPRVKPNVIGNNITLVATLGTIGELGNELEIDSSYSSVGTLTSTSSDNTFITESTGDLWLRTVTAGPGATSFVTNPVGSIYNGYILGDNAVSGNLWLFARDNIGTSDNPVATRVGNIKGKATTGSAYIQNTGAVTIGGTFDAQNGAAPVGIVAGGAVVFGAHSPVTLSQNIEAGQITVISGDSTDGTADLLKVESGVQLTATAGDIELRSGDGIEIQAGAVLEASGLIYIEGDYGNADPGIGSVIDLRGVMTGSAIEVHGNGDADTILLDGVMNAPSLKVFGGGGADTVEIRTTLDIPIIELYGGSTDGALDTLVAFNETNDWHITGVNEGDINGKVKFFGFESLTGGNLDDTFYFIGAGNETGVVDGGAHVTEDTLDWIKSDLIREAALSLQKVQPLLPIGDETVAFAPIGVGIRNIEKILAIILGEVRADGTLLLNMGPRAAERLGINTVDGDENFVLSHASGDPNSQDGETIAITYSTIIPDSSDPFVITLEYEGVKRILGIGGDGNDSVTIDEGVLAPVTLWGDQVDLMAGTPGNDTLLDYGSGDAILNGGFGDDTLRGGTGNDELIGGPGNDQLYGSEGNDVLLGGTGQIIRAFNADGSPMLDSNGSQHKDVLLTDIAYLVGSIPLTGPDVPCGDINAVNGLLNADVTLLTGEYNADGSKLLNADGSWTSQALLLNLIHDGNDTISGGSGDDAIYGQRGDDILSGDAGNDFIAGGTGNDTITGGDGNDTLVGDDAFIDAGNPAMPNVTHGLFIVHTADSIEASLGIDLGMLGTTVVPMAPVAPGREIDTASFVLPHVFGYDAALPADNSLHTDAGGRIVPYVSVITDFGHHLELLHGNDTVSGNDGNDTLVGDDLVVIAPAVTFDTASMAQAEAITRSLLGISDAFSDMVHHQYTLLGSPSSHEGDHDAVMIDNIYSIGEDTLDGGAGNDVLIGDDSKLIAPLFTLPVNLAEQFEQFMNGTADAGNEIGDAALDLVYLEHSMRDTITQVQHGRHLKTEIVHHVDLIMMGNDVIYGGDGNDFIVGDNLDVRAPSVTLAVAEPGTHFDDHDWHDREHWGEHGERASWWKGWGYGDHHDQMDAIEVGSDIINGGAGNDLIWGDSIAMLSTTIIRGAGISNRDFARASNEVDEALDNLITVSDDSVFWLNFADHNHDHSRDNYSWLHIGDRAHELSLHHDYDGGDIISGGDGNDIIFGQDGSDVLHGDAGDDWLIGGADKDVLVGGSGRDKLYQGENRSRQLTELVGNATPLINWNGMNGSFFDATDKSTDKVCSSAWLNDFLNHVGQSENERNPNNSLKVRVG